MNILLFRVLAVSCFFILSQNIGNSQNLLDDYLNKSDQFLGKNVKSGLVNYKGIKKDPEALNDLLRLMEQLEVNKLSEPEQKAFWINTYNICVIKGIVTHYPVTSPMDIKGFFDQIKYNIGGESITLNDIENTKLRAAYQDARIHFALVCAALSCPSLASFAYRPEKLDEQLRQQTSQAMNDPQFVRMMPKEQKAEVSEIFKWYKEDFTRSGSSVRSFINIYRNQNIPAFYSIDYYTYDWKLNDLKLR